MIAAETLSGSVEALLPRMNAGAPTTIFGNPGPVDDGQLRRAVPRSRNAKLLHAVTKGVWMKAQDLSRAF